MPNLACEKYYNLPSLYEVKSEQRTQFKIFKIQPITLEIKLFCRGIFNTKLNIYDGSSFLKQWTGFSRAPFSWKALSHMSEWVLDRPLYRRLIKRSFSYIINYLWRVRFYDKILFLDLDNTVPRLVVYASIFYYLVFLL